jgi:antitoxin CptB
MDQDSRVRRLARLRYRSWHRGTREMDLLLGPYADRHLAELDETALDGYERLLELPDPELFAWFTGYAPVPPDAESPALRRVMEFCRSRRPME